MDGGRSAAAQWRSSIPGVWQLQGAPATLGIVAWHGRGSPSSAGGTPSGRSAHAHGRRQPWRAIALAGLALLIVVGIARVTDTGAVGAAARTGWELTGAAAAGAPGSPATSPSAGPGAVNDSSTGPPDWWAVLAELDQRRGRALSALDFDRIADYAQPASAAWESDAALVTDMRARGLRPQGLTSRVVAVERSQGNGGRVRVQVVDQRSAYTLVDEQGSVVESVPESGLTRWWVTLIREAGRDPQWRVADVTSSGDGAPVGEP